MLPCCFALIRLPDGAAGQGRRSKVTDLLPLDNCQLGLGLVTLILSSVVNTNTNPVGLVTLMKGQRSKVTYLLYLYNCQLGLGLVTLIISSVVNLDTNPDPNRKRTFRFQVNLGATVTKRRSPG